MVRLCLWLFCPPGFRDEYQLQSTQGIVMQRLADDREHEECRVLMKFWWQLAMTYQEVTPLDLDRHVTPVKRQAVQELIDAIRQSPEAIDAWIAAATQRFPVIHDRGYETNRAERARYASRSASSPPPASNAPAAQAASTPRPAHGPIGN
jgi:hypothetical protein